MLTAVWVAVIVALAFWVVLACVAVAALRRFSRLIGETSRAVAHLRDRSDGLIDRGHAAIDRADEQLARTDAITASMDTVTANMAELTGRVSTLAPLARLIAASADSPLARVPAFAYGVARAVGKRRAASQAGASAGPGPAPLASAPSHGLPTGRVRRRELAGRRGGETG
jgi:uncharacterized protein YoxC